MAEEYSFTPRLEALFDTLRRKKLGGQAYDERVPKDFAEGAYAAAIAKNLARRKLAEDKEYRDKALAASQEAQDKALAQNATQFDVTTKNTEAWRAQQAEDAADARKDAETGNMVNALLKGVGMIPEFFKDKKSPDGSIGQPSFLSKAGDAFRKSLGGQVPGNATGVTTGGFVNDEMPDNWDLMGMPASAPVAETAAPAIGTKVPGSLDSASYNEAMGGAKPGHAESPKAATDQSSFFNNQASLTNPGGVPAIGTPVETKEATGMTKGYEDTEVTKSALAAEPSQTLYGEAGEASGAEGISSVDIPAYVPPAFAEFKPAAYVEPTFSPYENQTFSEQQYRAEGGKYGKDWETDYLIWMKGKNDAERSKYNNWVADQRASSKAAYDNWLAQETENYNTAKANAEAAAKSGYNKYVESLKASADHSDEHASRSPWSYNTNRVLGGRPAEAEAYYGNQFTPDPSSADARRVHEYEMAGLYNPGGTTKEYYNAGKAPTFSSESQGRASFDVGEFQSSGGWESPYNYSKMDWGAGAAEYNSPSSSYYDYSPSYEAFNYEPPPSYGGGYSHEDSYSSGGGFDSGGGKIVCTELNRQGYLPDEILAKDSECREKHIPFNVYTGYLTLFGPVVALMRRSKLFANIVRPFGVATAKEMASRVDPGIRGNWLGKVMLKVGVPLCGAVGNMVLTALKTAVQMTEVHNG